MLEYLVQTVYGYIKKIIPKKRPALEPVPYSFLKTDSMYYDFNRPTFSITHWVPSSKTFYSFDIDTKQYTKLSNELFIMETSQFSRKDLDVIVKTKQPYIITKPLNFFTFDDEKQEFVAYKDKLKISLSL